eukprot:gene3032-13762_t
MGDIDGGDWGMPNSKPMGTLSREMKDEIYASLQSPDPDAKDIMPSKEDEPAAFLPILYAISQHANKRFHNKMKVLGHW